MWSRALANGLGAFGLAITAIAGLGVTPAHADGAWVLWARTCSLKGSSCSGEWQQRQKYEAERWCRAARTTLVNQALTREAQEVAARRGTVLDYQCLPDSVKP